MVTNGPNSPKALRAILSAAIGVSDEPQDWDIVNASPERFEEFASFLRTNTLAPTQIFDMVGLVFASANERLLQDPSADLGVIPEIMRAYPSAATVHHGYWASLEYFDEFPLSAWLREHEEATRRLP